MKKIFLLLFCTLYISAYSQEESDVENVQSVDLKEVVVTGENAWIEGDKYIFIPQKRAKNLSRNMEDLIERMHTGVLVVEDGEIKTRGGQQVNVFVNGVPADNLDKSTFWAKNAQRVEFMEFSDDPRFMGMTNIVNFIMREYVAGGLTKFDAEQQFPNEGDYSVASKLVWGKMTYNAMFKGSYSRDHQSGNETTEYYDGIHYNGSFYDQVCRQERADDARRNNNMYGGVSARYSTEKLQISHNVSLQWQQDPGSYSQGSLSYTPGIIQSDRMLSKTDAHSLSPAIEGFYSYWPSQKLFLALAWNLKHSHNNNHSSYEDKGLDPILTDSRENNYGISGRLTAGWYLKSNLVFSFAVQEIRTISDIDYSGNILSKQWQNAGSTTLQVSGWWRFRNNLTLKITPELTLSDWNVNHSIKRTEWQPGINANVFWSINNKNSLSLNSWYTQKNPAPSQRNDLILQSNELKWIEGNPEIDSSSDYWITLAYATYPSSIFNTTVSLDYIGHSGKPYLSYRAGGLDYDGVIGQYHNSSLDRNYRATWSFNINLFDGNVTIGNQLYYNYDRINGRGLSMIRTRPYISWDFGNCSLSANYGSPEKFFSQGGTQIVKTPSYYNLTFRYGNGNFMFDVGLSAPFNKYLTKTTIMDNGPYHYTARDWENGRNVSVSVTYTFDYGKKVSPGVDIYEKDNKTTSVLGSD